MWVVILRPELVEAEWIAQLAARPLRLEPRPHPSCKTETRMAH
jgi:hypothetical protein